MQTTSFFNIYFQNKTSCLGNFHCCKKLYPVFLLLHILGLRVILKEILQMLEDSSIAHVQENWKGKLSGTLSLVNLIIFNIQKNN